MTTSKSRGMDAKTWLALAVAIIGGGEMRVQVGLMQARLDRIEAELRVPARVAANR